MEARGTAGRSSTTHKGNLQQYIGMDTLCAGGTEGCFSVVVRCREGHRSDTRQMVHSSKVGTTLLDAALQQLPFVLPGFLRMLPFWKAPS